MFMLPSSQIKGTKAYKKTHWYKVKSCLNPIRSFKYPKIRFVIKIPIDVAIAEIPIKYELSRP